MQNQDEVLIQQLITDWAQAVAARDIDRVMSYYVQGEDFRGFDFVPPFVFAGADAFREEWERTFQLFQEDPTFELKDLTIHCGSDVAVLYGLSHFKGMTQQGPMDIWTRQTNAFRKIDGQWLMIHEHVSVPVDMPSMKGVLDFRP